MESIYGNLYIDIWKPLYRYLETFIEISGNNIAELLFEMTLNEIKQTLNIWALKLHVVCTIYISFNSLRNQNGTMKI